MKRQAEYISTSARGASVCGARTYTVPHVSRLRRATRHCLCRIQSQLAFWILHSELVAASRCVYVAQQVYSSGSGQAVGTREGLPRRAATGGVCARKFPKGARTTGDTRHPLNGLLELASSGVGCSLRSLLQGLEPRGVSFSLGSWLVFPRSFSEHCSVQYVLYPDGTEATPFANNEL